MRSILTIAMVLAGISAADAYCVGTNALSTCYDDSGNSYTVNRFGNQTHMNGYNAQTGSTWSQDSTTLGNSTYHTGQANGRPWNETETRYAGGIRSIYGTDSEGNSFNYQCAPYSGCQ